MESVKKLAKEFNQNFNANWAKIFIALFFCGLLVVGTYICLVVLTLLFTSFVPVSIFAIVSFVTMLIAYAVMFMFFYGFIILLTRLERGMTSSLGYLFLGFKHKRIKSAVCVFSFLFLICLMVASIPLVKNIEPIQLQTGSKIFEDPKLFFKLLFMTTGIFIVVALFLFLRFLFTWNILYDNSEVFGFEALLKSSKMLKKNIFKVLSFEIFLTRYLLLILIVTRAIQVLIVFVPQLEFLTSVVSIINMIRFLCGMLFVAKVSYSIPFCYDLFVKNENLKS